MKNNDVNGCAYIWSLGSAVETSNDSRSSLRSSAPPQTLNPDIYLLPLIYLESKPPTTRNSSLRYIWPWMYLSISHRGLHKERGCRGLCLLHATLEVNASLVTLFLFSLHSIPTPPFLCLPKPHPCIFSASAFNAAAAGISATGDLAQQQQQVTRDYTSRLWSNRLPFLQPAQWHRPPPPQVPGPSGGIHHNYTRDKLIRRFDLVPPPLLLCKMPRCKDLTSEASENWEEPPCVWCMYRCCVATCRGSSGTAPQMPRALLQPDLYSLRSS